MFIEVDSNPNTDSSVFVRFNEAGPRRQVRQIRTFERLSEGEWCWVTGWTDDPVRPCCPAYAQLVEDSGGGSTHVVFGGIWGIRLKPIELQEDWDLHSPRQWGEPYLSLADPHDLRYAEAAPD
jgi:hypothetical protein